MKMLSQITYITILFLVIVLVPQVFFTSEKVQAVSTPSTLKTLTDPSTIDSYKDEFELNRYSLEMSGKVWGDKSVFSHLDSPVMIDETPVDFEGDFLEVFSLLGSTSTIKYQTLSQAYDHVFVLDLSSSMALVTEDGRTRIEKAVAAINKAVQTLFNDNEQNRVSVVCFGLRPQVLVPLAYYQDFLIEIEELIPNKETGRCIRLDFSYTENNEKRHVKVSNGVEKENTNYTTNIRNGISCGLDQFLKAKETDNMPRLILLSNGTSTIMNSCSPFSDELYTFPFENKNTQKALVAEGAILSTLMSAAYKRTLVKAHYNRDPEIITVGIDISVDEQDELNAMLDPKAYFSQHPDSRVLACWNVWSQEDRNVVFSFSDNTAFLNAETAVPNKVSSKEMVIPPFPRDSLIEKEEMIHNFYYTDAFYEISSDALPDLFRSIIKAQSVPAYHPIDPIAENALGESGALTYLDPIGEGLRVKAVEKLMMHDRTFSVEQASVSKEHDKTVTTYQVVSDEMPGLKEISIKVITGQDLRQSLRVSVPEELIPVVQTDVTVTESPDESFRPCTEFEHNLDSVKPLRLLYTLCLDENRKEQQEEPFYYTNRFSGSIYSDNQTRGEAYYTFVPSQENPYYFTSEKEVVYHFVSQDSTSLIDLEPLSVSEPVQDETFYYLKTQNITEQDGVLERIIPVSGASVNRHRSDSRTDLTSSVSLESGLSLHEDEFDLRRMKVENQTETASLRMASEIEEDSLIVKTFLGNNGKLLLREQIEDEESKLSLQKYQRTDKNDFTQDELSVDEDETVTYQLILKNEGQSPANEITVVDEVPEELRIIEGSVSGNGIVKENRLSWQIPLLMPEEEVMLLFQVITPYKDTTTSWENSAFFYQEKRQINPEYSNKVVLITRPSVLMIEKSQSVNGNTITKTPIQAKTGDTLTYYLTVHNTGKRAVYNITVTDTIPHGLTPILESITNKGSISNNIIEWNVQRLERNAVIQFSFSAHISGSGDFECINTAYIREGQARNIQASNSVQTVVKEARVTPEIRIVKMQSVNQSIFSTEPRLINLGDRISYLFSIKNTGDTPVTTLKLKDDISKELSLDPFSISPDGFFNGESIEWTIQTLNPNEQRFVQFSLTVPENSKAEHYENTATYTFTESDQIYQTNTVSFYRERPEIEISKTQGVNKNAPTQNDLFIRRGDRIDYFITVYNRSEFTSVKGLSVRDEVASLLEIDKESISQGGKLTGSTILWSNIQLAPSEIRIFYFSAVIPAGCDLKNFENTADLIFEDKVYATSNTVKTYPQFKSISPTALSDPPDTGNRDSNRVWTILICCAGFSLIFMSLITENE